jgi:2-dehydropantoate 2-reductase
VSRFAVVGAGAIGSWLGGALARAGHDVAFLARGAALEAIRTHGLRIEHPDEAYTVHPRATDDPSQVGEVDAVFLAVKAHAQPAAGPAVHALLAASGPDVPVVGAQNGIPWWYFHGAGGPWDGRRVEASDPGGAVSAAIAPERALGLVVYLGARITAPGVAAVHPEHGLVIGEPNGSSSPRLALVAGALEDAGFPVRVRPDIRAEVWTKLLGNAAFNPVSVLTRASLAAMVRDPEVRALCAAIMGEAMQVAAALGSPVAISIEERLAITERLGEHKPSTLQDLEAGRSLELDAISGAVVELADLVSVAAPALRLVHGLAKLAAAQAAIVR